MKKHFKHLLISFLSFLVLFTLLTILTSCGSSSSGGSNGGGSSSESTSKFATTPSQGLKYEERSNGYVATGLGSCTDTKIYIPDTHNGKPVIGVIGLGETNNSVTSIKFGKNVEFIASPVFDSSNSLKYVQFNDGLKEIQQGCFMHCENLTDIDIPSSVVEVHYNSFNKKSFKEYNGVYYVDNWCVSFSDSQSNFTLRQDTIGIADYAGLVKKIPNFSVTTNNGLKYIGAWAFRNSSLSYIYISNSVISIGNSAFENCDNLAEIYFPDNIITMGSSVITSRNTMVYCEAYSKPYNWNTYWNTSFSTKTVWGATR